MAHQGTIELDSEPGKGTKITVTLPTVEPIQGQEVVDEARQDVIDLELESLTGQQVEGTSKVDAEQQPQPAAESNAPTVLIIEDNPDMRDYIHQSLNVEYQCVLACNGKEGVEKAQAEIPDIIVSDVMMPIMDGYQVTETIKSDDKTSHIPVVLLTARSDRESRLKGWHQKADEYLTKPFDAHELRLRLQNLLSIRDLLRQRFNQTLFTPVENKLPAKPTAEQLKLQAQTEFLDKLNEVLETEHGSQELTIPLIASKVAMSERQLFRKLKGSVGMNPTEYLRRFRLEKACGLLAQGVSSSTVALEVGFSSHSYFTRCFSAQYGCAPSEYVK